MYSYMHYQISLVLVINTILILDKPLTPNITGKLSVSVNSNATLTCSSQSTSAPDYYSKLVTLSYTWFVNDTKIHITSRTLVLNVTKDLKYNRYSCTATEEDMESDESDQVQINPLCKIAYFSFIIK